MSTEEKQNSPTYQDSNLIEYPQNEKEVSIFIKRFYKPEPTNSIGIFDLKLKYPLFENFQQNSSSFRVIKFILRLFFFSAFLRNEKFLHLQLVLPDMLSLKLLLIFQVK